MKLNHKQLLETLKQIFDNNGKEMATNASRVNAFLMDLAPDNSKERKLICSILSEGIGSELLKVQNLSFEEQEYCIKKCIVQIKQDTWIAEEAAKLGIHIIACSLGIIHYAEVLETESPSATLLMNQGILCKGDVTGGDEELKAALMSCHEIGYKALAANTEINTVVIPDNIKCIRARAFQNCINLNSIQLPATLDSLGSYVFRGCSRLKSISIPKNRKWIVVNGMLLNQTEKSLIRSTNAREITSYHIPDTIERIVSYAFDYSSAQYIFIPKNVNHIGYAAFTECMQLERFEVHPKNMIFSSDDGILHSKNRKQLLRYPSGIKKRYYIIEDTVETIADAAFSEAIYLESITFTNQLKQIGNRAFEKCIQIESLVLPSSIKLIGAKAFQFCEKLFSVMLPNSLLEIGDFAFCGCIMLKTLTVPKNVRQIGHAAFKDCSSLQKVVIQENVSIIGNYAFDGCSSKLEISIQDNPYAENYCRIRGIDFHKI